MNRRDKLLYAIALICAIVIVCIQVDNYFVEQGLLERYDAYNNLLIQEALQ